LPKAATNRKNKLASREKTWTLKSSKKRGAVKKGEEKMGLIQRKCREKSETCKSKGQVKRTHVECARQSLWLGGKSEIGGGGVKRKANEARSGGGGGGGGCILDTQDFKSGNKKKQRDAREMMMLNSGSQRKCDQWPLGGGVFFLRPKRKM